MHNLICLFSRLFIIASLILINVNIANSQIPKLFINEFMASNDQTIADEYDEYDDWIEIYNDNDYSVNVSGFYLTDDLDNPTKWAFPDVSITAKGFLLIWADDDAEQGSLHTNFQLSADGEQIGCYDGSNFVDSLTYSQQTTDISYGRYPDGGIDWYSFSEPSPDAPNNDSIIEYAEAPTFSPQGRLYYGSVTVELSVSSPNATIRYTLDCYEPTEQSLLYTEPIVVAITTVIRARTFEQGKYPSEIITQSYVLDMDFDIAALSMVTDPPNLWDSDFGIYVNYEERGDDWERPVSLEFYKENNDLGFAENAGMRIHGGGSRRYDKKSFRLYFRSEYGQNWLPYPLFAAKNDIDEFKRLIVHAGSTDMPASEQAADGWTLLRDPLMHEFCHRIDGIYAANHPVAVYLNAEPWGIYNLIERPDEYYIYSNFGELDVDIIEDGRGARVGDMDAWHDMINFFKNNKLNLDSNYETAKTYVDIDNYTDYNVVQLFGGNRDWPDNNYMAFRPRKEQALWRWIIWDLDQCFVPFGLMFNTLEFATNKEVENTEILISLLENENYKNLFINRFADLLNTIFLPSATIHLIDSLADVIRNDINYETDKWGSSPEEWEQQGIVDELYDFANKRPDIVQDHIEEKFSLSGHATLTLETPQGGQGQVKVNSIYISDYPWSGIYFKKIPVPLTSIPEPGYLFVGWSDPSVPQTEQITITLYNDYSIYAIFEPDEPPNTLVINEINYNSSPDFNPEDWIELYNPSDKTVDVSGWHLKDDDDDDNDFIFPEGTTIDPDGFLIVCHDQNLFHSLFPDVTNYIGDFDFGLSGGGDQVRIFSPSLLLIDSVAYDDDPSWPIEADGTGSTLELLDPDLDNTLAENWQASAAHGSPAQATLALPVVTGFVVKDSSGSTDVTDSRDVLIEMTESDYDGNVVKWHINESGITPAPAEFILESKPTSYHIESAEGDVTIYGWVLDNDNQVSHLTDVSQDTILLQLDEDGYHISGTVNYDSKQQPVSEVVMTLTYSQETGSDTTDENGSYAFSTIAAGDVTLKPVKQGDIKDAITGSDVLFVLQYLAFLVSMTDDEQFAADVTADGNVTGSDAQAILRYLAFYPDNIGSTGQWRFDPQDTSVTLNSDTIVDFNAYLLGDANLDWDSGSVLAKRTDEGSASPVSLIIGSVNVVEDQHVEIPISITAANQQINTLIFSLEYDPGYLHYTSILKTRLSKDFLLVTNGQEKGLLHIAMAGVTGINGDGEIVRLNFQIVAPSIKNKRTKLTLARALANDRIVTVTSDGEVIVAESEAEPLVVDYALFQNYPNPFNLETQIQYQIPRLSPVRITIYNLMGNKIRTLIKEDKPAGSYQVYWDGKDDQGKAMSSGIYLFELMSGEFVQSKKMIMMK